MQKRIILIPKDDLIYYPPTISLINVLLEIGVKVVCVGDYSDQTRKKAFEQAGVEFVPIVRIIKDVSKYRIINWIIILGRMMNYKRKMKDYLLSKVDSSKDLIWFIYSNSIAHIQKYIEKHEYVVQFYEFENYALNGKDRLLHPSYDVHRFLSKAKALVHCEYNRAAITNGLYGIDKHFYVLPNKPYGMDNYEGGTMPDDVKTIVDEVKRKTRGKKVILYQGIFDSSERRLEEFCDAMSILPDEYVFIAMGGRGGYFEEIRNKYASDKIIFIPFIRPPHHLYITQLASIGVLTYHPAKHTYVGVINPLYCAPNKIFEFGKYGIPMIANDVPGLKLIFGEYGCGGVVDAPITCEKIADVVKSIGANYDKMSKGALAYYNSVDIKGTIEEIIEI